MLPLDPGKLNIKSEGAVGWRGRGSAKHTRLAFSFSFFQQAAGKRGREDTATKLASEREGGGELRYCFPLFLWAEAQ